MAVLLTGGAGYIGSHTAVELMTAGYDVVIADDLSNSSEKVLGRIELLGGKKPVFYNIDVCDKEKLRKVFSENEIEAAIHFAGKRRSANRSQSPSCITATISTRR